MRYWLIFIKQRRVFSIYLLWILLGLMFVGCLLTATYTSYKAFHVTYESKRHSCDSIVVIHTGIILVRDYRK